MDGIKFKNKHSYNDFGLTIKSKEISPPKKKKIKEEVPFMNGTYDFSNLYGEQTYEERTISYTFNLVGKNKLEMNVIKQQVEDWLLVSYKTKLEDDIIPGYYFLAECEEVSFSEENFIGELSATFIAYPFKYRAQEEGNLEWDSFNFLTDYMQDVEFNVIGTKNIDIYNPGSKSISPTIICDSQIDVIKDTTTYKFNPGTTKDWRFTLDKGLNNLTLNGTGNIEFRFKKEVL